MQRIAHRPITVTPAEHDRNDGSRSLRSFARTREGTFWLWVVVKPMTPGAVENFLDAARQERRNELSDPYCFGHDFLTATRGTQVLEVVVAAVGIAERRNREYPVAQPRTEIMLGDLEVIKKEKLSSRESSAGAEARYSMKARLKERTSDPMLARLRTLCKVPNCMEGRCGIDQGMSISISRSGQA